MIIAQYKNIDLSKYNEFLNSCTIIECKGVGVHEHHIIPKFMGGNNDDSNLIILNYKDHQLAHIILAECFNVDSKEYKGNIFAAQHCSKWIQPNEQLDLREKISCIRKGIKKSPESIKKQKETKRLNGTDKPTELTRKKMSESQKRYDRTGNRNPMFGRKHTPDAILKCKISSAGPNNGMYGRIHSDESKQKMSDKLRGTRDGHKNNKAKKIQCIETGMIFGCMKYASEYYNISGHLIRKKIKQGLLSYTK